MIRCRVAIFVCMYACMYVYVVRTYDHKSACKHGLPLVRACFFWFIASLRVVRASWVAA